MANIKEQLLAPEDGWKRYNDTDSNIIYNGIGWTRIKENVHYNKDCIFTHTPGENYVFYVYTSRIRIISQYHYNMGIFTINIDDNYTCDVDCYQTGEKYQCLMFEKNDLEKNIHKVTATLKEKIHPGSNNLVLDAIDIDEDGCLLSKEFVNNIGKTGDITFNRVLKNNLPSSVSEKIGLYFTEDKGLYINNNDGALVNINHNHTNENVLDLISADDNNLLFNGNIIDVDDPALTDEDKSNIIANIFSASGSDSIIHGTYGMQYISESKKDQYELALKICEDNSDFYYSSAYWTNDTLLNENDYTDMTKNSKYECFINKPVKDMIMILNDIRIHIHLDKQYNSLKELFTNGGTVTCEEFILYDTNSVFGYDRAYDISSGEIYNIGFFINYNYYYGPSDTGGMKLGFAINNVKSSTSSDNACTYEGLGLFSNSSSGAGGRNEKQSCNSGRTAWQLPKQFSKAFVYIK